MDVFEMSKEDFAKVPARETLYEDVGEFDALVIIPTDQEHDSGYMCMDFVAVDGKGEPICRLSGWSDILELDGIGGYGAREGRRPDKFIEPKAWGIDCLPCGYLRLFSRGKLVAGDSLSSFEVYAK